MDRNSASSICAIINNGTAVLWLPGRGARRWSRSGDRDRAGTVSNRRRGVRAAHSDSGNELRRCHVPESAYQGWVQPRWPRRPRSDRGPIRYLVSAAPSRLIPVRSARTTGGGRLSLSGTNLPGLPRSRGSHAHTPMYINGRMWSTCSCEPGHAPGTVSFNRPIIFDKQTVPKCYTRICRSLDTPA